MSSLCIIRRTFTKENQSSNENIYVYQRNVTKENLVEENMNLTEVNVGEEYIVKDIAADDEELTSFLFSLGCYSGEPITVVSRLKGGCVVSIKDGRYNIDNDLAEAIIV